MHARLLCATFVLISMGMIGCGAPQPPLACTEEPFPWWKEGDFALAYCEELGMVCNEAVTLEDACPGFLEELEAYFHDVLIPELTERIEFLPWPVDLEALADRLFGHLSGGCGHVDVLDQLGTCQLPGVAGDPCAEDADCEEPLTCAAGVCE